MPILVDPLPDIYEADDNIQLDKEADGKMEVFDHFPAANKNKNEGADVDKTYNFRF